MLLSFLEGRFVFFLRTQRLVEYSVRTLLVVFPPFYTVYTVLCGLPGAFVFILAIKTFALQSVRALRGRKGIQVC